MSNSLLVLFGVSLAARLIQSTSRVALFLTLALLASSPLVAQGPVVLMGIDAEDQRRPLHGPRSIYANIVRNVFDISTATGVDILVIGGGKSITDLPTIFWNQIGTDVGVSPIFVNGATDIAALSDLSRFKLVVVVSSEPHIPGGLTNEENNALTRQASLISLFVNSLHGGLISLSQGNLANPYGFLGGRGSFTFEFGGYRGITPTEAGMSLGITDALARYWHDQYLTFPSFLQVLAVNPESGNAAALGGTDVLIDDGDTCTVPRFDPPAPVPIWRFAPLCRCVQDDVSRAFGCFIRHPDFLLTRWIPWPLRPGQEFTIRFELTAFADLEPMSWTEELPQGFPGAPDQIAAVDFASLSVNQSASATLAWGAPAEVGLYEGGGVLTTTDGRMHAVLNSYEISEEVTGQQSTPTRLGWWILIGFLAIAAVWIAVTWRRRLAEPG